MAEKKVWLVQNYNCMQVERVFYLEKKALEYVEMWCKNINKADWGYVCYENKKSKDDGYDPLYYVQIMVVR